jgi:serine phosphatase RsbU (regulator of sigma subunit)
VDIGGDWYDLIPLGERRAFLVIGDVSGRGVQAGTTMASLRFAIRAFVSEGHGPAEVLRHLTALLDVAHGGQFATILCGVLDGSDCQLTAANAGHLPPLLLDPSGSQYLQIPAGPPIGVRSTGSYREVTVSLPRHGTLLAFTDGLVERPGETLDESLERLRSALHGAASLTAVFDQIVPLLNAGSRDDIAILGVQWPN